MMTLTFGRIPASSHASSELSTASFTVVSSALRGLSKPSRWRFFAKNSETEISFCLAAIDSAVSRLPVVRLVVLDKVADAMNRSSMSAGGGAGDCFRLDSDDDSPRARAASPDEPDVEPEDEPRAFFATAEPP